MKIVVAYDGSDPAKRALDRAAELATNGDKLIVVAAAEPHASAGSTPSPSQARATRAHSS
jgi:nucleotide-binding universal stress UspA family protein